jgi:hypothetical protein
LSITPIASHVPGSAWQNACTRASASCVGRQGRENDARRSEYHRDDTRLDHADPDRSRLLVARAGDLGGLMGGREPVGRDLERREDVVAPAPVGDVEKERPRGVRGVDRPLPGETKPNVVLREHHAAYARVDVRLVSAQPEQLRRGEARERPVAGERDEPLEADALLDLRALGPRALVVPEDGGAEDFAALVEADEAVHLPREPDALGVHAEASERRLGRSPPIRGILLRPSGPRRREWVALLGRGDHITVQADRERLDAGGPDVEADEGIHSAPSAAYTSS